MAEKKPVPAARLEPIEKLKEDCQTKDYVFSGMMAANGWRSGKQVTKEEYVKAEAAFLKAPIGGKEPKNVR